MLRVGTPHTEQMAKKEIVTRPMSEYFANDPECHDLLPCALRSHRVTGLGDVPHGRRWVESRPRRLRPCGPVRSCGPVPFAVTEIHMTRIRQPALTYHSNYSYFSLSLFNHV